MTAQARRRAKPPSTSPDRDPVGWYAAAVLSGFIVAGPLVRAAAQRHLDDLKNGAARGLAWKPEAALRAIEFFPDVLCLADGDHAGKPFNLGPEQKFIVGSLFGWYMADGYRRFHVAYIEEAKGNGKSPLAAGIGIYMLTADGEAGAEVYAAAAIKDQAKILYRDAVAMVQQSEDLGEILQLHGEKETYNMVNLRSRGFFKPISSEKRGLDGKRVHCALLDEVHEHPEQHGRRQDARRPEGPSQRAPGGDHQQRLRPDIDLLPAPRVLRARRDRPGGRRLLVRVRVRAGCRRRSDSRTRPAG
jgi:phage terminase large subunit-like protein